MKKKNMPQKKPRNYSIKGEFTATTDKMTFKLENDKLVAFDENGNNIELKNFEVSQSYRRDNKPNKILNKIYTDINSSNNNKALSGFDFIYGIDTNTKFIDGLYISVGAIIKCIFKEKNEDGFKAQYHFAGAIESTTPHKFGKVEQRYWTEAIKFIQKELVLYSNPKIGLVVDCDLENIRKYNNGEMPLYSNIYLPKNFKLIYASADNGREYLPNKIIRLSDKEANRVIKEKYQLK